MMEQEDPTELRVWYWELEKKRKAGTFTKDDAALLVYICIELGKAGYTTNEDESDWIPPQKNDQESD